METNEVNNSDQPAAPKQNPAKLWLWILPLVGLCLLAFCAAGGSLFIWQTWRAQSGPPEAALAGARPEKQPESAAEASPTSQAAAAAQSDPLVLSATPAPPAAPACPDLPLIESSTPTTPTLSGISFATRQGSDGWPTDPALQFTTTVTKVLATFSYAGMSNGLTWERVWLYGDQELSRSQGVWDAGPQGQITVQMMLGQGNLVQGTYKLALYVAGQLASQGAFTVVTANTPITRPVEVAYTTWDGQKHRLNLLNLSNSQTELLVESGRTPAWSPDAVGLLFYGEDGLTAGPPGLWVLNMGQRKPYPLSDQTFFQSLAWSPLRTYVASTKTEATGTRLVLWDVSQNQAYDGPPGQDPAWSPEGQRLAFRGCDGQGWHIHTVHVINRFFDSSSQRTLTSGDDSQPAWSWDGQRLAFVRREGDNQDIYVMASDGSNLLRLTNDPAADVSPAWTPDQRILFYSQRGGRWAIYSMNPDGSDQRLVLDTPSQAGWQPDRLAVSTNVQITPPGPPKPQIQIPPGRGLLAVSNQKNNDEMTFTIDNIEHKIKPYQLKMIPLKPGHYTWTASWPGKNSRTGIADIVPGQIASPVVER